MHPQVRSVMHEAFRVASSGKRGPVHIDLPKDIMTAVLQGAAVPLPMQPPPQARGRMHMHMHGMHIACAFCAAGARRHGDMATWHMHGMHIACARACACACAFYHRRWTGRRSTTWRTCCALPRSQSSMSAKAPTTLWPS